MSTSSDGKAGVDAGLTDGARGKWSSVLNQPGPASRPIGDLCPRFLRLPAQLMGKAT